MNVNSLLEGSPFDVEAEKTKLNELEQAVIEGRFFPHSHSPDSTDQSIRPYVYLIEHIESGRLYYGVRYGNKTTPYADLWRKYFTSSKTIKKLVREHGPDKFRATVRQVFDNKDDAIEWETLILKGMNVLYNDLWMNENVCRATAATPEIRRKISEFHKDKPKSLDHRKKISEANTGKIKGPISDEHKQKLSDIFSGEGNPMFGVVRPDEWRKNHSEKMKGRPNLRLKGVPRTEEQKRHQSEVMKRRKVDPEVAKRIGKTLKSMNLKRERLDCEHCGKNIPVNIYARYHGNKCKEISRIAQGNVTRTQCHNI